MRLIPKRIRASRVRVALVAVWMPATTCLWLAGCPTPFNTRFPTLDTAPVGPERRSYTRHDPFPDESFGPDTFSRPRGFEEQRSEPRRSLEGSVPRNVQDPFLQPPPYGRTSSTQYPNAVPN